MDSKQTRIVLIVMLLVAGSWLFSFSFLSFREPAPPLSESAPKFDAAQAFQRAREFVTRYPKRVLGSFEARGSTGYLRQELEGMGYKISYTHFEAILNNRRQVGRNVLAFTQGATPEVVAVVAHYDTAGTTIQGAMDNGAGVATLLELARIFAGPTTRRSLLFVASDGEEWGMLGAADVARNYPGRDRIIALLSLDYVALGELAALELDTAGQRGGYAPPWLREISRAAAESSRLPVREPYGFQEHLERSLLLSRTDQGPFLNAGIPAINLGSRSKDGAREAEIYHSSGDTIENLNVASLEIYGKTAEKIIRTIDEVTDSSRWSKTAAAFRIRGNLYLAQSVITTLHFLTFLPLLAILYFHWMNHAKYLSGERVGRESLEFLSVSLPFFLAYASIFAFRRMGWLPRYSLYPATPKDPVLENPFWGVLVGILALGIIAAVALYFLRRFLIRKLAKPDYYVSKTILIFIFAVLIAIGLQYNSYWTVSFLALPAWIWGLTGIGRGPGGRAGNRIWIIAAGMTYFMLLILYAGRLGLGWKIIWFQTLALANGMFQREGALLALATISLGLRFFAIQSYSNPGESGSQVLKITNHK
jgi:hypothetical protein